MKFLLRHKEINGSSTGQKQQCTKFELAFNVEILHREMVFPVVRQRFVEGCLLLDCHHDPLHKIQPLENQLTPNAQQPCIPLPTIPYQRVLHSGEPGQKCWDKIKSKLCECKVMSSNATKRRQCCTPCSHSGSPATGIGRTLHGHQNAGIKLSQNFVGIGAKPKCQDKIKSKLCESKVMSSNATKRRHCCSL